MKRKEIGLYRTQNEKKYNEIKNKHFQLYGKLDDEKLFQKPLYTEKIICYTLNRKDNEGCSLKQKQKQGEKKMKKNVEIKDYNGNVMIRAKAILKIFERTNTPFTKEHFMKTAKITEEQYNEIVK